MHESSDRCCGHAEFLACNVGGALGRRDDAHAPALIVRGGDCRGEHRGLACPGCAFHDHERVGRCDGCGRVELAYVELLPEPCSDVRHVTIALLRLRFAGGEQVAQFGFELHHAQRCEMRHMLRCGCASREDREAVFERERRRECDQVPQLFAGSAHAVFGDDPGGVLLYVVACPRRGCGGAAIQRARRHLLHR